MLLQLSDSNWVTLDVLLRTYLRRLVAPVVADEDVPSRSDVEVAILCTTTTNYDDDYNSFLGLRTTQWAEELRTS